MNTPTPSCPKCGSTNFYKNGHDKYKKLKADFQNFILLQVQNPFLQSYQNALTGAKLFKS